MGDEVSVRAQVPTLDQLKNNLKSWNFTYWLIFFGIIPLLLLLISALPLTVKDEYFIFHTSALLNLPTYVLSSYSHGELYPHMAGNLVFYFITISAIFAFETNKRRFHLMAGISLFIVPVICSLLTIALWHFFGTATRLQGFSGIDAAFLAYAFIAGVTWFLGGSLELFDHRESFTGSQWRYYVSFILMNVLVAFIVLLGIVEGQFISTGSAISNGIAHFGGFITGLVSFVIFDLMTEKRKNFDTMLIISIGIGVIFYIQYLNTIVKAVKGF